MKKITVEQVEHIAELARLELTGEEIARYSTQLNAILDYFGKLRQVDTSQVAPMSHPLDLANVLSADEVGVSVPHDAALANAPDVAEGCFRVPVVLDQ
jgi:aspartyl-tRNA(Asn)/glutamyl-tRNA(Gln) amidotransferase subunit C